MYTDGITEARNHEGEEFGYDRLRTALDAAASCGDADAVRQQVLKQLYTFTADVDLNDDHTMLVIRFDGNPATDKHVSTNPG
jgi:serine phosphatase RsbU (regulator of sigma subunit)